MILSDFLSPLFVIDSVQVLRTEVAGAPGKFEAEELRKAAIGYEAEADWSQASRSWSKLGKFYRDRLGEFDEAIKAFERVIELQKAHLGMEKRDRNVAQ